ncbi:hypothetical protein NRIC_09880 [Enterococcus florum]|uniref:Uncharacterized protein n=1 Tax=Enterococcus florum TaxID=2480627 RepID=A0A4P5P5H7_9ENTE|nr:hypothetical protein [Enterococcus florum]GCF93097.1 hypothetical protein NRIC_09880 [Enterococcus florum]
MTYEMDLSAFAETFSEKPLVIGGLAMDYYGIRPRGKDIDLIVTGEDFARISEQHPGRQRDKWGDLILTLGEYEILRSIFRFDYAFFSEGAIEREYCKIISLEKLFFMKVLAYENQPEVEKHTQDYQLMLTHFFENFQNREYVETMNQHIEDYLNAPDGTI